MVVPPWTTFYGTSHKTTFYGTSHKVSILVARTLRASFVLSACGGQTAAIGVIVEEHQRPLHAAGRLAGLETRCYAFRAARSPDSLPLNEIADRLDPDFVSIANLTAAAGYCLQ
jgi:hypothetical protein